MLSEEKAKLGYTRLKICKGCDLLKDMKCTECGCDMASKVLVKEAKCPRDKWKDKWL